MTYPLNKAKALKLSAMILFAIAVVFLVSGMLTANPSPPKNAAVSKPIEQYDAWVVVDDLTQGTLITRDMMKPTRVTQLGDSLIQNPDVALGRRVKQDVIAGAYLTSKMLVPNRPVIDDLPENYRAIAIRAGEVLTVGGYLQPGDHVDVMLLLKPNKESGAITSARRIASDLMVLAIGQQQNGTDKFEREAQAKSVVLAVHESLAPVLLLADASGEIRLAAVGSKELAAGTYEPSLTLPAMLLQTASLSTPQVAERHAAPMAGVVELRQFNPQPKPTSKPIVRSSNPVKRSHTAVNYVEVIQGRERTVVKANN